MNIKGFGVIALCLVILGITAIYYIPLIPTIREAWGSANASANVTMYTGVSESLLFMPIVWLALPFGIVGTAIFWYYIRR